MQDDPMNVRMVFLRIGWMNHYKGQTSTDQVKGGGAFVAEHGYGHEIFNFQPFRGEVFGYVQPPGTGYNDQSGTGINLGRLGAAMSAKSLSNVIAVWVARSPGGGTFIVGWYRNATVHRYWQPPPSEANRRHAGDEFGFYVTSPSADAVLLPPDERTFQVPRGSGGMGQANIWYADSPDVHAGLRSAVLSYVKTRQTPVQKQIRGKGGSSRQPDPLLRQKIEAAAITTTTAYYRMHGYQVTSVEGDNVGWDLEAFNATRQLKLKLEVKGLSGCDCRIDLTPNELAQLKNHRDSYRLCVVTLADTKPNLAIFAHSAESQQWEDQHGRRLVFQDIIAARCRAE